MAALTRREISILELMAQGMCNKLIARELGLALNTIKNMNRNAFKKLKVSNRIAAVHKFTEGKWVDAPVRQRSLTSFQQVKHFHTVFDAPVGKRPGIITTDRQALRWKLLHEELAELANAEDAKDIVGIADGIGDCLVILLGTAVEYGIDMDAVLTEIYRSNMSKLDEKGLPIFREDGKILKGPNFSKPDLKRVLYGDDRTSTNVE